jgi:hypothetical protein
MVALSGSLAHLNAEGSADLDLFVIVAPGRVWSVTLAVLVISRLLGWRQRMCLNYVISERAMTIEPADLFSANQIIHLRPIVGHDVFETFVDANPFVKKFYPNFEAHAQAAQPKTQNLGLRQRDGGHGRPQPLFERVLSFGAGGVFESAARAIYGWHLRRRAATWHSIEQVRLEPECLKLHTRSHRASTLESFDAAMRRALAVGDRRSEPVAAPVAVLRS